MKPILAMAKTTTMRLFRDKAYIFFLILLPVMFLLIFGAMYSGDSFSSWNVAVFNDSDSKFADEFIKNATKTDDNENGFFSLVDVDDANDADDKLVRGEIDTIITLPENFGEVNPENHMPSGELTVVYREGSEQTGQMVSSVMQSVMDEINAELGHPQPNFTVRSEASKVTGLTNFDYVFAGLLGYTILSLGLVGVANVIPADKKNGAIKRIHATPITNWQFIFSYMLSFLVFGVLVMLIMVSLGLIIFDFDMRGSWLNFAVFALLSTVMMFGFGLAIAGWAKNENQGSVLSNIMMFPMMFLSGVFFPIFMMPELVQKASTFIPLTPIVDGMRLIMTENFSLIQVAPQLALIAGWGVLIYIVAVRVFRWE